MYAGNGITASNSGMLLQPSPGVSRPSPVTSQCQPMTSSQNGAPVSHSRAQMPYQMYAQYMPSGGNMASPHAMASRHAGLPATPTRPSMSGYSAVAAKPMPYRQRLPTPHQATSHSVPSSQNQTYGHSSGQGLQTAQSHSSSNHVTPQGHTSSAQVNPMNPKSHGNSYMPGQGQGHTNSLRMTSQDAIAQGHIAEGHLTNHIHSQGGFQSHSSNRTMQGHNHSSSHGHIPYRKEMYNTVPSQRLVSNNQGQMSITPYGQGQGQGQGRMVPLSTGHAVNKHAAPVGYRQMPPSRQPSLPAGHVQQRPGSQTILKHSRPTSQSVSYPQVHPSQSVSYPPAQTVVRPTSRLRPPMPPLIQASPPAYTVAAVSEDAPLDLSNPDGPLDLSVKSRKRAASPTSQDDVILVKVSQPKIRRIENPPRSYPLGYPQDKATYSQEMGRSVQVHSSSHQPGNLAPTAHPVQLMKSPQSTLPGHLRHPQRESMVRGYHPAAGQYHISPNTSNEMKWRMPNPSPQSKDINGNIYGQGQKDVSMDAKKQSEELIRTAYNMRYVNNGVPAASPQSKDMQYGSGCGGKAERTPLSPKPGYHQLMQAGHPRPLEEIAATHVARPSLVSYDGRPQPISGGYNRGSITQGLPGAQSQQAGPPAHMRRDSYLPHTQVSPHLRHPGYPHGVPQSKEVNYQHSKLNAPRPHLPEKGLTPSAAQCNAESGQMPESARPNVHQFKPESVSAAHNVESNKGPGPDGKWNIIRIMHDLIENRIEEHPGDSASEHESGSTDRKPEDAMDTPHIGNPVANLPSGVRFHPSPEGVPRAPFKGERPQTDRTIPVANVNPILQSSNPLLHPKKQLLYQSRLDSCREKAATPVKDAKDGAKSESPSTEENTKHAKSPVSVGSVSADVKKELTPFESKSKSQEVSKMSRKLHMVPIKERFKSKKMYNREQALQSVKSGTDGKSKMTGRKPGRPRTVAPLMKKVTKVMKKELARSYKYRDQPTESSSKADDSTFDFGSQEKEEEQDNDRKEKTFQSKRRFLTKEENSDKPRPKRGRPRTRPLNVKTESEKEGDNKKVGKRKGRRDLSETESGSETRSRRGTLHERDLSVLTRHQAANVRSTRRGTLYNKNEAYEKELRRDEYRKFLLRIKRQAAMTRTSTRRRSKRIDTARAFDKHRRPREHAEDSDDTDDNSNIDDNDDDDDLTEPASDSESPEARQTRINVQRRVRRKYKLRGRRRCPRITDDDTQSGDETDSREACSAGETGGDVLPEARRLVVCKDIGETLLHRAAKLGNLELVKYCLQSHVTTVNARDNAGYTALHESCVKGHIDVTRTLIANGADVNASALDGTRPIHDAVDNERFEIARLLLSCGADIRLASVSGRSVLKVARTDRMKMLIKGYLYDLNGPDEDEDEDEEPPPWTFYSSCSMLGNTTNSGFGILTDVPSEEEGGLIFDLTDAPHLPAYNICLDSSKGYRNYHILEDVIKYLNSLEEKADVDQLEPYVHHVKREDVLNDLRRQGYGLDVIQSGSDDNISFIKITDDLLSLLKVERFTMAPHKDPRRKRSLRFTQGGSCEGNMSTKYSADGSDKSDFIKIESSTDNIKSESSESVKIPSTKYPVADIKSELKLEQSANEVKEEILSSETATSFSVKKEKSSPQAQMVTPLKNDTAKLQHRSPSSKINNIGNSKAEIKTSYSMWNIKPCSVPIENSGNSLIQGISTNKSKFLTRSTDHESNVKGHSSDKCNIPSKSKACNMTIWPTCFSNSSSTVYEEQGSSNTNQTSLTESSVSTGASTVAGGTGGSNVSKAEIKIGAVAEDCLAELAGQKAAQKRQSSCDQRSMSPREAETPSATQVAVKPERRSTEDPADLPILEKQATTPGQVQDQAKPAVLIEASNEDPEMPHLTIEQPDVSAKQTSANKKVSNSQS